MCTAPADSLLLIHEVRAVANSLAGDVLRLPVAKALDVGTAAGMERAVALLTARLRRAVGRADVDAMREAVAVLDVDWRKTTAAQRRRLVAEYQPKVTKATACLLDDWERLVTYYRFPKEHWKHPRTTNIIESPFASLRLRTDAAKRFRKVENATLLLWKLLLVAQKSFRKLDAAEHLRNVLAGRTYEDGNLVMLPQGTRRAA
ncbi:transposase [Corallococcus sp. RDP092CA]|uniref:transposase n=1 Tax=Corallococcus sp. RDP092CA TaxID=3109369 RepID=UPI0035B22959